MAKRGLVASTVIVLAALVACAAVAQTPPDAKTVERVWKAGKTLPAEMAAHFPNAPLKVPNDNGINVLVDVAHQCAFATMWGMPGRLHELGFRSIVSHATLDTVVVPGKLSRVRIPVGQSEEGKSLRPFGWVPNPEFNVVFTYQGDSNAQPYLPEERMALEQFVNAGGGLVIVGNGIGLFQKKQLQTWADQSLATTFGLDIRGFLDGKTDSLPSREWEILPNTEISRRTLGQGRVVLVPSLREFEADKNAEKSVVEAKRKTLQEVMLWAAGGKKPVGGEARFSQTQGGGGGIYPECEEVLPGAVVYYAKNQKAQLLEAVRQELPKITKSLYAWLPSPVPEEPMFIIVAAGGGGGWAVNAFLPKETGVISLDAVGLFGVYAHELGHTMSGPRNAQGKTAADWFDGNQGEAHAGWWQGKILAQYSGNLSMRDCNNLFKFDKNAAEIDLGLTDREAYKKWDKGRVWTKLWWIWQKLDDRYGTTWYPRWRWVQYTRWQKDPNRRLSLDEMVEDMSIACGEDLFPFFKKIGSTLKRDRLPGIEFEGKTLKLAPAPLEATPAGNARQDPIGDYKRPLPVPSVK